MAMLPCIKGPHKHPGRNVNVYCGDISQGVSTRSSGRFCLPHWNEIQRRLDQFEVDPDSGALSDPSVEGLCISCAKPVDESGRQLFITSYPAKDDRKDYWSRIHDLCPSPLKLELKLTYQPG
jgi:hypothetical protein